MILEFGSPAPAFEANLVSRIQRVPIAASAVAAVIPLAPGEAGRKRSKTRVLLARFWQGESLF
jgi:uncharacterized membrane protein YjjB (DUF3815 family)